MPTSQPAASADSRGVVLKSPVVTGFGLFIIAVFAIGSV